ncbi:hypothetical protein HMPREF1550_01579 [Actinomyces sp. oral taxon 877 str. F0543]|nr:hypothetical protein HMPREF1550_01579 [Actinomyces sp. oral taxon 877 str. F0543]
MRPARGRRGPSRALPEGLLVPRAEPLCGRARPLVPSMAGATGPRPRIPPGETIHYLITFTSVVAGDRGESPPRGRARSGMMGSGRICRMAVGPRVN